MHVIDEAAARKGLTLVGAIFLGQVGLMLLGQAVPYLVGGGQAWHVIQELGWVGCAATLLAGAWLLSKATEGSELPRILMGLSGLVILLDLFWVWRMLQPIEMMRTPRALSYVGMAVGVASVVCWCVVLAQLAQPKAPWAVPVAAVAGLLGLSGTALTLAGSLGAVSFANLHWVRTALSLVVPVLMAVLAFRASGSLIVVPPQPGTGPVAVAPEPGGARLVFTGAALLLFGVGVTVASFSSAQGGGRYVVATGAIATGLLQLVRGLAKLGSAS